MPKLTAPYNFVPLSDHVYLPDWAEQVSHDIPFSDGEDGVISVRLKNHTPMFIGEGESKDGKKYSAHVEEKGGRRYFIPSTTLKGCFRGVMEIVSFAKMNRFENDSFGYRAFNTNVRINGVNYTDDMQRVKSCGWLYRDENGKYWIDECYEGIQKIKHEDIRRKYPRFNAGRDHETAEIKQRSLSLTDKFEYPTISVATGEISYPKEGRGNGYVEVPEGKYTLVCTGYMARKKVEYLFSEKLTAEPLEVSEEIFRQFDTIHKNTEYYAGKGTEEGILRKRLLKDGEKIPVFFEKRSEKVVTMGITRNYRYPFNHSVMDCIPQEHKVERYDLPELIFGRIDKKKALRGRVQIGNAFCTNVIADNKCHPMTGVFGQPHASYYPLYVDQSNSGVQNYSSNRARIAGRKRYRVVENNVLPLTQGNGNDNTTDTFYPIPAGQEFELKIRLHNLRPIEIGALLSAITFNNTRNTFHTIGHARSYGYGKVSVEEVSLDGLSKDVDVYIQEFNEAISYFLQTKGSSINIERRCLDRLVQIASATHSQDEMKHMSLDNKEFEYFKQDPNKSILKENENIKMSICVDESELRTRKLEEEKRKIREKIDAISQSSLSIENRIGELENLNNLYEANIFLVEIKEEIRNAINEAKQALVKEKKDEIDAILNSEKSDSEKEDVLKDIKTKYVAYDEVVAYAELSRQTVKNKQLKEKVNSIVNSAIFASDKISELEDLKSKYVDNREVVAYIEEKLGELKASERQEAGLSFLKERNIHPLSEGCKRIEQYKNRCKIKDFADSDKQIVKKWLLNLPEPTSSKEKRDFTNSGSNSWNKIENLFGNDQKDTWFDMVKNNHPGLSFT